ncbi:methyl-accepting chemotaxis protein [Polycladidibacter stylochi]|uniref:methyl-accepting chemotaxis protein n=1 Tax=Polycladidibacter stylochi TaxID=1807766 RepID=UPI00082DD0BE|nr:methyl-accepting chemotaxis protein [Pseudovibrio stylochi]
MEEINNSKHVGSGVQKGHKLSQIGFKLPLIIVGLAIVASSIAAFLAFNEGEKALTESAKSQLRLLATARKDSLADEMEFIQQDIQRISHSNTMRITMGELAQAVRGIDNEYQEVVNYYQPDGSSIKERRELTGEGQSSVYSWRHSSIHNDYLVNLKLGGYEDILVLDSKGMVIYSANKSSEFLKKLHDPVLSQTYVASIVDELKDAADGVVSISPAHAYKPAGGEMSVILGTPIYVQEFKKSVRKGTLIVRLNASFFDSLLNSRQGLGNTGQAYLVNYAGQLISNKPLSKTKTALKEKLSPEVMKALEFNRLSSGAINEKFNEVDGKFYYAIKLGSKHFPAFIVTESSVEESLAAVHNMQRSIIISGLIVIIIAGFAGYFFARRISKPLSTLAGNLQQIEGGNLEVEIPSAVRKDEIGEIGRAVLSFKEGLKRVRELDRQSKDEQLAREERVKRVVALNENFDKGVRSVLDQVTEAGGNLGVTAESMASISEQTNSEAQTVSSASEQSLMSLQAVAGAAEELSATVGEIDREVRRSADISNQATDMAKVAEGSVNGLLEAAHKIGEVVSLINDIADQTNLLALNATIEAARAGEAGKGFAVVASEVKGLANQTGRATGEISIQIQAVQAETEKAVVAIKDIAEVIGKINDASTAIAGAIQEQAVTATDISSNIQQVTAGSSEIAQAITRVSVISGDAGHEAEKVLSAAGNLNEQSEQLKKIVEDYLIKIQDA